jgi:hypothetical protein
MNEKIRKAIQALIDARIPIVNQWATVVSIDGEKCTVKIDDLEISEILLGFSKSGIVEYPTVNTDVLVGFVNNSKTAGVVLMCEKVDSIQMMGDVNSGIVKHNPLKGNLQSIQAYCNALKTAVSVALGSIDIVAGSASKPTFDSTMAGVSITLNDMENTKIKHGNG